jgi:MFS family permease
MGAANETNEARVPVWSQVIFDAFRDWYDDWVNLFLINILFLLCWVTIILGPPALFGLYYITDDLTYGKSQDPQEMIRGMRKYFLKSWQWFSINLVIAAIIIVNFFFYRTVRTDWALLVLTLFMLLGVLWLVVQFYALPYMMEQEEKSLKTAYRNGLFTILGAPGYTFVVVGFAALLAGLSIATILPIALAVPVLIASIGSRSVRERLETLGVRERDAKRYMITGKNLGNK